MQLALFDFHEQGNKNKIPHEETELTVTDLENGDVSDGFDLEIPDATPCISSSDEQLKLPQKFVRKNNDLSARCHKFASSSLQMPDDKPVHIADQSELYDSKDQMSVYKEKTIDDFKHCYNDEKRKNNMNDMELELQNLRYKLEKEVEERSTVEILCKQLKEQLLVIEGKLTQESDIRRLLGIEGQKQKDDILSKEQKIHKLEHDLEELKLSLENEINAKILQKEKFSEKIRHNEHLLMEYEELSKKHADVITKLETSDKTLNQTQNTLHSLRVELAQAKDELVLVQSLLDELKCSSDDKLSKLREKIDDKTEKLINVEKDLFQVQLQCENEKIKRNSIEKKLENNAKDEMNARSKLEEEIGLLKHQLDKSKAEFDLLGNKFKVADYECKSTMLQMNNERKCIEKDLGDALQKLNIADVKLSDTQAENAQLNDELKSVKLTITETNDAADSTRNILQETKNTVTSLKEDLREEKMMNNKLESKLETAHQRINLLQAECDKLSKELTYVKEEYMNRDRIAQEKSKSTDLYINTMKENFDVEKADLLLDNKQSNLLIDKLQKQLSEKEGVLKEKCSDLEKCIQDLGDATEDLTIEKSEKSVLDIEVKKMMQANSDLTDTIGVLRLDMQAVSNEKNELEIKINNTMLELENSKALCAEMTQRVQKKGKEMEILQVQNGEIKSSLQEMKRMQLVMEADLREEKVRYEATRQDLMNANKGRERLEVLFSNVKGNNANLEERLNSETFNRTQREQEIMEQKGLLELEMKSRSKIGVKVIELEKQIEGMKNKVEEEKRKAQSAIDQNEVYEKRSLQHQQEISGLRNKLKQYQRRLKEGEANDSRLPVLRAEFDVERQTMSANLSKLRRQLDQLSEQLTNEQNMRDAEEKKNRQQLQELTDLKTNEKVQTYEHEKVQRRCFELQEELEKQRDYYERNFCPTEEVKEFKKSLETKARMDLHKKLQEVNMLVEEQSLSRQVIDNLRSGSDRRTKTGYEEAVTKLKNDLFEVKASLNDEQTRTNHLFNDGISKVTKDLCEESFRKNINNTKSPQIQNDFGLNNSIYRPKTWNTPVRSACKSPFTLSEPLSSIKRRNLQT